MSVRELRQYSNYKIFAALAAILVVALGATGGVIYCLQMVLKVRQESIQITKVQMQLSNFYNELLTAEVAEREFLITGQEDQLQPYQAAIKRIPQEGAELEALGRPYLYADKVKQVRTLASQRLAHMAETIMVRREQGAEAAAGRVRTGEGRRYTDQVRALTANIAKQQSTVLAAKRALATGYGVWANWIAAITLVVIGALAGLVYYLFLRAIKAERALDRAKDEFVSLASHQLRTPATGVKSILSVLRAEDVGPLNTKQIQLVGRAIESNERELRIVDELLNVARLDAGRLILNRADMDVLKVVDMVVNEQGRTIEDRSQTIQVRRPDHPVRLMADQEKVYMAVSNLIDNASKYTGEGGQITVSVQEQPKKVLIEVRDTGMGIKQHELNNIFDRFQRAHSMLVSGAPGTGLGLYLARRIAELHHGAIQVRSKEGKGSTFTLSLPRQGPVDAA